MQQPTQLQKGQRLKLSESGIGERLSVELVVNGPLSVDVSCFGVNEQGRLQDERYMVFYNQLQSPQGEVRMVQGAPHARFDVSLGALPRVASKLMFTATIDGSQTMRDIGAIELRIGHLRFSLTGKDFAQEKAIIMCEIYQKEGLWRLNAVGQGFNGGLEALLVSLGGSVAAPPPTPSRALSAPPPPSASFSSSHGAPSPENKATTVFLEKRVMLEKTMQSSAPQLVSLAKKAAVSLEKRGLGEHRAKVALCLDISYSMQDMYRSGVIQSFVERILALASRLDDDGSIDVFLFGEEGYQAQPITIKDFQGVVTRLIAQYPLEPDTRYAKAVELVRKFYTPYKFERSEPLRQELPVYVMFLTDGQPSDKAPATRALKNASMEPIFWQFMGVGNTKFTYLESLDELTGRHTDNAGFFKVASLTALSDEALYEQLMQEYPLWLKNAKTAQLL